MRKIAVFSGTTEGRELSGMLSGRAIPHLVFVAGEYGREMMPEDPYASIHTGRMDAAQMAEYLRSEGFGPDSLLIDATHPYAEEVTGNIRRAAEALGCGYRRVLRGCGTLPADGASLYADMTECAGAMDRTQGNILLTTGSKELPEYCRQVSEETRKRTFVRVLPSCDSIRLCQEEGISSDHIIAMHGPFSAALNRSVIAQYRIRHLVTKESGDAGGFREKAEAAAREGVRLHVILRPVREEGEDIREVFRGILGETISCEAPDEAPKTVCRAAPRITLAGCGMGDEACRTIEAGEAVARADIVFGSARLLHEIHGKKTYEMYRAQDIIPVLERERPESAVILFSGDTGFYSGAGAMARALKEWRKDADICILPGIPTFSYLAARLQESYEDAALFSLHGRNSEESFRRLISEVRFHEKTFVLLSGTPDIRRVAELLVSCGIEGQICAGIDLSGKQERIDCLSLEEALSYEAEGIASILIRNRKPERRRLIPVLQDADFIRGSIPMTKECVRHESMIRLAVREGDLVYDIGGGTGSVAIEIASLDPGLHVYSIEKKPEAAQLMRENIRKTGAGNVTVIEQDAAQALPSMPKPDCVFIGGSGGRLREIMDILCAKGTGIRYVINAVSLETMEEVRQVLEKYRPSDERAVQLSVSDIQKTGNHHMMRAQNPVTVFSFTI